MRVLRRDHRAIVDPEVALSSSSARKTNKRAIELAEDYNEQPLAAVMKVATRELGVLAQAVEGLKNLRWNTVRNLCIAYAKLTAVFGSVYYRAEGGYADSVIGEIGINESLDA